MQLNLLIQLQRTARMLSLQGKSRSRDTIHRVRWYPYNPVTQTLILLLILVILMTAAAQGAAMQTDEITLPTYRGYISVAENGRYFVDEDSKGFLVIGQNDAISWPGLSSLVNQVSPEATENYIIDLREHGITVSRVMIEYAQ